MEKFNHYLKPISKWWEDEKQIQTLKQWNVLDSFNFENLKKAFSVLELVYPQSWDCVIDIKYVGNRFYTSVDIVVYFPHVEITNSRKETHDIYDLYVKFPVITNNDFEIKAITGFRGKMSAAEIQCSYTHSHLPSIDYSSSYDFENFCTGSGVINQVKMMFNASFASGTFDDNLFKMYLFEVEQFVKWESLEGGPFNYLRNVRMKGGNHNLETVTYDRQNTYSSRIIRRIVTSQISFDSLNIEMNENNEIYIVDDDSFEQFLVETLDESSYEDQDFKCSKDDEGEYVMIENNHTRNYDIPEIKFYFRGELKVVELDMKIPVKSQRIYAHPTVKLICKSILEYEFNKSQIKSFAFR